MPEFQRRWRDWAAENIPADGSDRTDKTDESASVSFVRPIAEPVAEISPLQGQASPDCCFMPDCRLSGYVVELGGNLCTRLCTAHRRELFRRAREMVGSGGKALPVLFKPRPVASAANLYSPRTIRAQNASRRVHLW